MAKAAILSTPSSNGTPSAPPALRLPAVWEWHPVDALTDEPAYPGWDVHVRANYSHAEWDALFGASSDVAATARTLVDAVRVVTPEQTYDFWPDSQGVAYPLPSDPAFWDGPRSIPTHLAVRVFRALRSAAVTLPNSRPRSATGS